MPLAKKLPFVDVRVPTWCFYRILKFNKIVLNSEYFLLFL